MAAVTCPGGNLSYQWQKKRPVSVGGTGLWEDIPFAAGYIGGNTPTLDITVAHSITGGTYTIMSIEMLLFQQVVLILVFLEEALHVLINQTQVTFLKSLVLENLQLNTPLLLTQLFVNT